MQHYVHIMFTRSSWKWGEGGKAKLMHVRSRLTVLVALALPLPDWSCRGGRAVRRGCRSPSTDLHHSGWLGCQQQRRRVQQWHDRSGLNSAPAEAAELLANVTNGSSTITINKAVVDGQR